MEGHSTMARTLEDYLQKFFPTAKIEVLPAADGEGFDICANEGQTKATVCFKGVTEDEKIWHARALQQIWEEWAKRTNEKRPLFTP